MKRFTILSTILFFLLLLIPAQATTLVAPTLPSTENILVGAPDSIPQSTTRVMKITYANKIRFDRAIPEGAELIAANYTTVDALDINGYNLYQAWNCSASIPCNRGTNLLYPVVKLDKIILRVVSSRALTGGRNNLQQLIVQLPPTILPGTHHIGLTHHVTGSAKTHFTVETPHITSIPATAMLMWPGASSTVPDGYSVCHGWGGKFPVGAGLGYAIGSSGGRTTIAGHRLSIDQLPRHSFTIPFGDARNNAGSSTGSPIGLINGSTTRTNTIGSGITHSHGENRPPYKPVLFICKN